MNQYQIMKIFQFLLLNFKNELKILLLLLKRKMKTNKNKMVGSCTQADEKTDNCRKLTMLKSWTKNNPKYIFQEYTEPSTSC